MNDQLSSTAVATAAVLSPQRDKQRAVPTHDTREAWIRATAAVFSGRGKPADILEPDGEITPRSQIRERQRVRTEEEVLEKVKTETAENPDLATNSTDTNLSQLYRIVESQWESNDCGHQKTAGQAVKRIQHARFNETSLREKKRLAALIFPGEIITRDMLGARYASHFEGPYSKSSNRCHQVRKKENLHNWKVIDAMVEDGIFLEHIVDTPPIGGPEYSVALGLYLSGDCKRKLLESDTTIGPERGKPVEKTKEAYAKIAQVISNRPELKKNNFIDWLYRKTKNTRSSFKNKALSAIAKIVYKPHCKTVQNREKRRIASLLVPGEVLTFEMLAERYTAYFKGPYTMVSSLLDSTFQTLKNRVTEAGAADVFPEYVDSSKDPVPDISKICERMIRDGILSDQTEVDTGEEGSPFRYQTGLSLSGDYKNKLHETTSV